MTVDELYRDAFLRVRAGVMSAATRRAKFAPYALAGVVGATESLIAARFLVFAFLGMVGPHNDGADRNR